MSDYEKVETALRWLDTAAKWAQRLAVLWAVSIVVDAFVGRVAPYDHISSFSSLCMSSGISIALLRRWTRLDNEKKARSVLS